MNNDCKHKTKKTENERKELFSKETAKQSGVNDEFLTALQQGMTEYQEALEDLTKR